MGKALILAACLTLAACVTSGGSFCDIAKPVRLSEAEIAALSDASVADILARNEKGQRLCGWKP